MDDALLVRGFERIGDLQRNQQRVIEGDRARRDPIGKRRPLDQLHDQRGDARGLLEPVNVCDVRMVQRREDFRLTLESGEPLRIAGNRAGSTLMATPRFR